MKPPQYYQVFAADDLLQNFGIRWQNVTLSERKRPLNATVDKPFVIQDREAVKEVEKIVEVGKREVS